MDWKEACRLRLLWDFQGSFFNHADEFIAHRYSNTYFIFANCESEEDVKCKVLEWLSRSASKGIPYSQEWRNKKFRKFMLDGINMFLNTKFSAEDITVIYTYLGNACNHNKTLKFIRSGYDLSVLDIEDWPMNMRDFYNSNSDFRGYVERFRKTYNLSVDEALQHASVREAEKYYREKEAEERNIMPVEGSVRDES